MNQRSFILPIIVLAQFCCTSLWFAGNAVMSNLVVNFNLDASALGYLTSAVQLGFIAGTLSFAIGMIVDRYAPSTVFLICAVLGAVCNLGIIWPSNTLSTLLIFRCLIGFFLAGIYPVGMKIATDYFEKGLGKSLSFLVGALVLGTAFPHLLNGITNTIPWKVVLVTTSSIAVLGGLLMFVFVPNGPYRKPSTGLELAAFFKVFNNRQFRTAALGYFGHMWELYTFWAFIPVMLYAYNQLYPQVQFNIPLLSFLIIGIGSIGCILGGYVSQKVGVKKTAFVSLLLSCICCLIAPFILTTNSSSLLVVFLLFWGMVVIADSPLFSTLVAQSAIPELKGTALTIVTCIGYLITIFSIQLIATVRMTNTSNFTYTFLAIGPCIGLVALYRGK